MIKYPKNREILDELYEEWYRKNKELLGDRWIRPEVYSFIEFCLSKKTISPPSWEDLLLKRDKYIEEGIPVSNSDAKEGFKIGFKYCYLWLKEHKLNK